jgi:predicted CXXCH cytochrome family protein
MGNLCVECHKKSQINTVARFDVGTASNTLTHNPSPGTGSGAETSHFWGGNTTAQAAAGSGNPTTAFYTSRYAISTNRITCTICHDPHGEQGTKLVRAAITGDLICQQCHGSWFVSNVPDTNATLTHPIVADYATFAAANPTKYKATLTNTGSGDVRLVNGGVSCTSCHATHYADSSSATLDGATTYNNLTMAKGDGNILRTDGPLRTGATRNGATGTAQLRSNLCQSCHTYKMHGKGASGDHRIGCLDCHGGHAYNGGLPNAYILNKQTPDAVPTRPNGTNGVSQLLTFPNYPATGTSRARWSDETVGTANGYCEKCHGDVNGGALVGKATEHQAGNSNECTTCHKHNDPSSIFSFNVDASAATCGQCHGFPPYRNVPGDRLAVPANDGGYAQNNVDLPAYSYSDTSHFKDETTTGHKTHAGADLPTNPGDWYFVGVSGIDNCKACHGANAGTTAGNHRINQADTFRNLPFDGIAKTGGLNPVFNTAGGSANKCTATYCHSNGFPRTGDGPTRNYAAGLLTSPAWSGNGTTDGFGAFTNKAASVRCSSCHGISAATMTSKGNSARHNVHLGGGTMAKTFDCEVCHANTATATALKTGASDGRTGGEHINGHPDVDYKTSGSPLYIALGTNVNGSAFNAVSGTCSVYCHDPADTGKTADWDLAGPLACDACHAGKATDTVKISSGSHPRHVTDLNGPGLACSKCHGAGSDTGAHTSHFDGAYDYISSVCNGCHAYDAGETALVWGNAATSQCRTCHAGATTTAAGQVGVSAAPAKIQAMTTGHGKTSGSYSVSNRPAANQDCEACHDKNAAGHFDGDSLDKRLLVTFSCEGCHDGTPAVAVLTHSNTAANYTGQKRADFSKTCLACHDPHGSTNITMIAATRPDFAGTVVFTSFGNATPVSNDDSFDELETVVANANNDDICATCHTAVLHNNRAVGGTHNEGKTCVTCHSHSGTYGGFMPTGGNACNDCHGNPPATGAHARHTTVATHDLAEDRSDCAICHPGADSYVMGSGGNHQNAAVNLAAGMAGGTTGCTSACHVASASDGYWTDANGLNCNSCHYYNNTPTSAGNVTSGNSEGIGPLAHNKHFDKSKLCSDCHALETAGVSKVGPLTHINDTIGANEGAKFTGMAAALPDEAGVVRAGMTFDDINNTCSGGIGLGCHATGIPDWDIAIPAGGTGCVQCHSNSTDSTVNPYSGLHFNNQAPTVSGVKHDGTLSGGCVACHTNLTAQATHMNGTLNGDSTTQLGLFASYTQSVANVGTCSGAAVGGASCHPGGDAGSWARKWDSSLHYVSTGNECKGCHGGFATTDWTFGTVSNITDGSVEHNRDWDGDATPGEVIGEHKDNTSNTTRCNICHVYNDTGYTFGSNHRNGSIEMNSAMGYNDITWNCTSTCHANNANHNLEDSGWTVALVAGPALSCYTCHGNGSNQYWPGGVTYPNRAGEHQAHITALAARLAITLPGTDAQQKRLCAYCHNDATGIGGAGHDASAAAPADVGGFNPIWDLTNPPTVVDSGATSTGGTCSSIDCHNNKTAVAGTYGWFDSSSSACVMCHVDVAVDVTHTEHTGGGFGKTINCASCHQAATTTTVPPASGHLDGTFSVAGSETFTYTGVYPTKGTCGTNSCHNDGKGAVPYNSGAGSYIWGTALTDCTACHNNPNASGNDGARHSKHMAANVAYVPTGCSDCHPAATAVTHLNGERNATGTRQTLYTSASGTCTNSCHITSAGSGVWTDALVLPCVNCHQAGTYIGGGTNLPASGLHNVTVALKHDATLASGNCINCHSSTPTTVATNHLNGTLQNATAITYAWNANVVSYVPATGCQAALACHSDGGDWSRRWSGVIDAKPLVASNNPGDPVCNNCHGDFTNGWRWNEANISTTDHTDPYAGNVGDQMSQHAGCQTCHGWGNATYASASRHIDGFITMNGPAPSTGAGYDNATGGCAAACHSAAFVLNSNSGWTANYGDYGAGSCSTCHGGATTVGPGKNYWPDGTVYPNNANGARHLKHMQMIADKLGITLLAATDVEQKRMCSYCHANVGGSGHNDNVAPADTSFHPLWDATNPASVVDSGASFDDATGVCSNIDCHNNKMTLDNTYDWNAAGTSTCTMCHTPGGATNDPISGLHNGTFTVANSAHDDAFATGGTCTSCHTTMPVIATISTHINGTFNANGTIAGDKTAMGLFALYTASTISNNGTGSCSGGAPLSGTSCHGSTTSALDAGTWARRWDSSLAGKTDGTECKGCHGGFAGNDWTFGNDGAIADNNVSHNKNWDGDATANEVFGNHSGSTQATACNICHVYGDPQYAWATNHRNGKITMNTQTSYSGTSWNCTAVCHQNNTGHSLEASSSTVPAQRVETVAGPALACYTCHGGGTANSGSGYNYWPDGTIYPDIAGGSAAKSRHQLHIEKLAARLNYTLAVLTDQQQKTMCGYCHPTVPGANGHNDNVSPADVAAADFNPIWSAITSNYPSTADGGTAAAWATATQQCSGIDCHNNQATSGTWAWNSNGTSSCMLCHTPGAAGSNPTSGLHNIVPTVSGVQHDDSFGASGTCVSCHTTLPAVGVGTTHINGTFTGNGNIAGDKTNMGLFSAYTATADNIGTCVGSGVNGTGCHAGASNNQVDAGTWARVWNSTVSAQTNGTECQGCHGGFSGADWTFGVGGVLNDTTDNLVSHSRNWDGDANTGELYGNHANSTANTSKCNSCHVYGDAPYATLTTYHRNGGIEMNSTVGYSTATRSCTSACHAGTDNNNHIMEASGATVNLIAGPSLGCSACHGGAAPSAGVSSASSHVTVGRAAGYNTFVACTECHPGGLKGIKHAKNGDANVVAIANLTDVGINYSHLVTTGVNGFVLGGDKTTGTTEAEICWNCHLNATYQGASTISEWGTNTQAATGNSTFNYGTLNQNNWIGATWTSGTAAFSYKTGAINSTHAANPSANANGVDAVANIRCSYCHDVHERGTAPGDTKAGKPFLRGGWRGNAYKEDGAPQANTVYSNGNSWGAVPRASILTTMEMGGFWIDQNSGSPNSAVTPTQFGGLCDLCHGTTKDGTLNPAEIDVLNQFGADNSAWISGYNGHKNSVKGGSGAGSGAELTARNIFNARGGTAMEAPQAGTDSPLMNFMFGSGGTQGTRQPAWDYSPKWGFRTGERALAGIGSALNIGAQPNKNGLQQWGVDTLGTTTNSNYHQFSCAKCHNPHASRLKKLMITNCLDTKHNKWDNGNSGTNATPLNPYTGINKDRSMSNWSSAQNCHRLANIDPQDTRADAAGTGAGWNKVTPWTDSDGYGTGTAPTFDYSGTW